MRSHFNYSNDSNNPNNPKYQCYFYNYKNSPLNPPAQLQNLGWQRKQSAKYDWDGLKRKDICYIFQYSIAGWGEIRIDEDVYRVNPGEAFIVSAPSNHRYRLPDESPYWEFVYITLYGSHVEQCWDYVQQSLGPVSSFAPDSPAIRTLMKLLGEASSQRIADGYQASALAYQFVTELYRSCRQDAPSPEQWPPEIASAATYMRESYDKLTGIEQLAMQLGVSKHHFSRKFHKVTGLTAVHFLQKIRIEKAIELLLGTTLSIDQIARLVGYSNGSYFCKIFHGAMGTTPSEFRERW
jgi:AraC-like DNA-binding protein